MKLVHRNTRLFIIILAMALLIVMLGTLTACEDMGFPASSSDEGNALAVTASLFIIVHSVHGGFRLRAVGDPDRPHGEEVRHNGNALAQASSSGGLPRAAFLLRRRRWLGPRRGSAGPRSDRSAGSPSASSYRSDSRTATGMPRAFGPPLVGRGRTPALVPAWCHPGRRR